MNTEKIDTVAAVSKLTGCPRSTIQSAIGRGEIETGRLAGGAVVVSVEDVRRWQADTERRPGPKTAAAEPVPVSGPPQTNSGGYNPKTGSY